MGSELPAMDGHQRRRRETRRQILGAARELFARRDLQAVSIDAITEAAGVAKGSFYNHFESRDALFTELVSEALDELLAAYRDFQPDIEDPLQLARARSRFAFATLLGDTATCRLMLQSGPSQPDSAIDTVLHRALGEELADAHQQGLLQHLDAQLVHAAYFGMVTCAVRHLLSNPASLDPEVAADQLTDLCFAVLGLPGGGTTT